MRAVSEMEVIDLPGKLTPFRLDEMGSGTAVIDGFGDHRRDGEGGA